MPNGREHGTIETHLVRARLGVRSVDALAHYVPPANLRTRDLGDPAGRQIVLRTDRSVPAFDRGAGLRVVDQATNHLGVIADIDGAEVPVAVEETRL